MLNHFYDSCYNIVEKHVPLRSKSTNTHKKSQFQKLRLNLSRRRRRVNKLLLRVTSPSRKLKLKRELVDIEVKLQNIYKDESENQENLAVNAIKINPKYFYSYAKKFAKVKTKIGPFNSKEGIITDPLKLADILLNQYNSVFSTPSGSIDKDIPTEVPVSTISSLDFNEDNFESAINELSDNSASGPDGFPSILLKKCKKSLSHALKIIWSESLKSGMIPGTLKTAKVVPSFKSGNHGDPSNYRPVSLTSHIIKLFEKVIRTQVIDFLETNNLLNSGQHGFRSGRSCLTQLIDHYDFIMSQMELGKNVDVIYLDFAKAFDKVDFKILLTKLNKLGISGDIYKWIKSFISDREQFVVVDGHFSRKSPVVSGVPQGSVLGPLLFLLLIGDIDEEVISSFVRSFADDTRVSKGVTNTREASELQGDLNAIYNWANVNNMAFNSGKFELLRYGKDDTMKLCTNYTNNDGFIINSKSHVKDLGVIISDTLEFKDHINLVIKKGRSMSSWVLRTFKNRSQKCMLPLWKTLVLPKMEYCSQLWCPTKKGDIQSLESIQWAFLRKIKECHGLSYWQALKKLKIYSIQRRFERYRIIHVWKILEGLVPNICNNPFKVKNCIRTGRKCFISNKLTSSTLGSLRYSSLPVHGARLFNKLPAVIRNKTGCSILSFKSALDKVLTTIADEPQIVGYTKFRRKESNSIIDMIDVDGRRTVFGAGHLDV